MSSSLFSLYGCCVIFFPDIFIKVTVRGVMSDFSWGRQRRLGEQSEPNQQGVCGWGGGRGGSVNPPRGIFFYFELFYVLLKPHEQSISAKIRYKN